MPDESLLVARVGHPAGQTFPVEWLIDPGATKHRDAVAAVRHELDFYLVSLGEPNPWAYAHYHAGTASNVYSTVHWSIRRSRATAAAKTDSLGRLLDVGFQRCGSWGLSSSGKPVPSLDGNATAPGMLYAFVSVRQVLYVGKTIRPLRSRMLGYQRPGPTQRTNIAVHSKITKLLGSKSPLDIYAFAAPTSVRHGTFDVNLAAGLEDAILRELRPAWNHVGKQ